MTTTQLPTTITGTDAVYYMSRDFDRARNFYENALGLTPASVQGNNGSSFAEYFLNDGTTFGLGYIPNRPFQASGGTMFAVADVKAAMERVKSVAPDVTFEFMELPTCDMAWAIDPEGNSFCLHHRKTP